MIQEQMQALGNVLGNVKRSKMVGLINQIGYQKIYAYKDVEEDLKGRSIQWIIEATNHPKFDSLCSYYFIAGNSLYSYKYDMIDFTDLAEYVFCRYSVWNKMPESVQEVLDNEEVLGNYKWEFVDYIAYKSGVEKGKIEAWLSEIEFDYRKDWFNLFCEFLSTL